ncbi:MAG: lipopolysaccharide biosynthesis protein, partial [Ginsengibacter sp.]
MTSIKKTLSTGIFYTALARYSGIVISIITGAVLARLLTPREFGIVALVTLFVTFFNMLSEFGLGAAIIQNQTLSEEDVASIFSFSILFGFILAALFYLAAPLIAAFYNNAQLVSVSRLLSLSVLFFSAQIVPRALYIKALKFKQMGIISLSIQIAAGIITIIMAYKGFSYYALVVQSILVSGFSLVVFYLFAPVKLGLKVKITAVKKIIRFSTFQFMFNFINFFSRNADNLLIGKYFGSAPLGYYDKSYRLMMMPVENLTHVITPVLMPVLSEYQDEKRTVYNTYLKVIKILATIGFPLSVFLYFSASEIIEIIYGHQWEQSIPVFKLLALTVGLQMALSSTGAIFQAVNRTDLMFYGGCLTALFMIAGICYGVFAGKTLISVAQGLVAAFTLNFFLWFYILIKGALKYPFLQFLT